METLALLELILFCVLLSELKSQFEIKFFIHSKENLGRLRVSTFLTFIWKSISVDSTKKFNKRKWYKVNAKILVKEETFTKLSMRLTVSEQLPPKKIASSLKLEFGLGLVSELGTIFLGGNCPRTEINNSLWNNWLFFLRLISVIVDEDFEIHYFL